MEVKLHFGVSLMNRYRQALQNIPSSVGVTHRVIREM